MSSILVWFRESPLFAFYMADKSFMSSLKLCFRLLLAFLYGLIPEVLAELMPEMFGDRKLLFTSTSSSIESPPFRPFSSFSNSSYVINGMNPRWSICWLFLTEIGPALVFLRLSICCVCTLASKSPLTSMALLFIYTLFFLSAILLWIELTYESWSFLSNWIVFSVLSFSFFMISLSFLDSGSRSTSVAAFSCNLSTLAFFLYSCSNWRSFIRSLCDIFYSFSCCTFFSFSISSRYFSFELFCSFMSLSISGRSSVFWIRSVKYMYFSSF